MFAGLALRAALGGVWARISAVLAWAWRNPAWALCGAMAVTLGIVWHDMDRWKHTAVLRGDAIVAMQAASATEMARAGAARDAAIQQAKDQDNATDKRIADARAGDARHLADYERRLRATYAAGNSGAVPAAATTGLAQSGNGPGGAAIMDEALSADLAICTTNSRRLLEIHDEAANAPNGSQPLPQLK